MTKSDTSAEQPPAAKRAKKVVNPTASTSPTAYVSHPCGLDADLWLQIASGLEFGEMIPFTSACKSFYKEVAPRIEKIKVMSSAHMHVIPARRFRGVKKAIVACLVKRVDRRQYGNFFIPDFDADTAMRFLPFLTAFPQLAYAIIGGSVFQNVVKPYGWWEDEFLPEERKDHQRLLNAQLSAVCGAYSSGLLSPKLRIDGLFCGNCGQAEEIALGSNCFFCESVCRNMPLDIVASLYPRRIRLPGNEVRLHDDEYDVCLNFVKIFQILKSTGSLERLLSPDFLLPFIFETTGPRHEEFEAERKFGFLWNLKEYDSSISYGDVVSRSDVEKYLKFQREQRKEVRIAGHFLEFLENEGLPLDYNDFDVVFVSVLGYRSKYGTHQLRM